MKHDSKEYLVELMINSLQYDYKEWEHEVNSGMGGTFHSYKSPDFEIENGIAWFFVTHDNKWGVHISYDNKKYSVFLVSMWKRWNPFHIPTNFLSDLVSRMKSYHGLMEDDEYIENVKSALNQIKEKMENDK